MSIKMQKKTNDKKAVEEINYPCSPRSQKWLVNLLPVLESYNYSYAETIELVKSCNYNSDKIQEEVVRIMDLNIGHEQGAWKEVKCRQATKTATQKPKPQPTAQPTKQKQPKSADKREKAPPKPKRENAPQPENVQKITETINKVANMYITPKKPDKSSQTEFTSWAALLKGEKSNDLVPEPKPKPKTKAPSSQPEATNTNVVKTPKPPKNAKSDHKPTKAAQMPPIVEKQKHDKPPVTLPKPLPGNFNPHLMFGCFEDDISVLKQTGWEPQVQQRNSLDGKFNPGITDHVSTAGQGSGVLHNTLHDAPCFPSHFNDGYSAPQYHNSAFGHFYTWDRNKHMAKRPPVGLYASKDLSHDSSLNSMPLMYGPQNECYQDPPGLIGYYPPGHPFYGPGNRMYPSDVNVAAPMVSNHLNNIDHPIWKNGLE
ncbi:hypothetical protein BdWA1_003408 [Babesia duncani]|uniref:Uncharacterized protein n=1 Tax=Babesia duncani TaxID=323732 RepID=A0AAD9PHR8_9APIC|nr:hypothetical protein BdWA1_003408 [Babesia duncani]